MVKLAAFFGNPGTKYSQNRHNAGWLLAQSLPFYQSLSWQKKFKGLFASYNDNYFLMPQTFMNLSGESVFAAASFYKVKMEEIIVVHDELELPLGTISLKFGGGLGGHNGLRSMQKCFGNADCWRLRIGIGRPPVGVVYDWVLSDFSNTELEELYPTLDAGVNLLQQTFTCDPNSLLDEWKKKKIITSKILDNIENMEVQQ